MFADSVLNKPHFLPCFPWADRAGWGRKRRTHWNKQRIFKFPRRLYYTILPRIIQFLVLLNRRIRFTFLPATVFNSGRRVGEGETGGPTCRAVPFPIVTIGASNFPTWPTRVRIPWFDKVHHPTYPTWPYQPYPTLPYHGYVKGVINVV